MKQNYVLRKKK